MVESQTVPISPGVQAIPGRKSKATEELVFLAARLPPLGSNSYYVQQSTKNKRTSFKSRVHPIVIGEDHIISTDVRIIILLFILKMGKYKINFECHRK